MNKLNLHTANKADDNFKKLAELFPNAITETLVDGEVVRAIDKDILTQEISAYVVEGSEERYQFTWPDKKKSVLLANAPNYKTLRPCKEESVDFDNTENLYIEGDNLDVLKLLQETYLGKVKMIYIDPPYNTGKDFVYADDFKQSINEYMDLTDQYDDDGNRLFTNSETNGRYHTDWLNMIYPRLKLAKDLLKDDGVIFISIDDNEVENLKKVCNEIFGAWNFVGCLILQTATDNNPRQINTEHEYILCFARNNLALEYWQAKNEKAQLIINRYNELKHTCFAPEEIQTNLRNWIKQNSKSLQGVAHYDNVDEKGVFHDADVANTKFGGYKFEVLHPITQKPCKIPDKGFRFPETTLQQMISNDEIVFGKDETTLIKPKKRIENAKDILRSIIYEDGRTSTKKLEQLVGRDVFQNPKSDTILQRIASFITKDTDIILDFFSGSATTAHAVMQLNAEDGGNRKFIMVQLPEEIDEKHEAYKAGYRTICDIGKERIRRAGDKIKKEYQTGAGFEQLGINSAHYAEDIMEAGESSVKNLDIGFRVLKCDSTNMKDVYYSPSDVEQTQLDQLINNIKDDRTAEDLLFQIMLDLGVFLSCKIETEIIDGKKLFVVYQGTEIYLIACFDSKISMEVVTAIAKRKPYYAVFRDSSMESDSLMTSFEQIFETYSKGTIRRVL